MENQWINANKKRPEPKALCLIKCHGDIFLAEYNGIEFIGYHNRAYFTDVKSWQLVIK